ncbi:hypothetical protein APE_1279a [Aeropyrum pernix K1]|uniref:Uncharacterized protein n=1 Tax=Aeropyrum pernix (strain ATCC 700893 / DSM 11879 / JCM 9820 / NBRC 100138 / K1) TaxID=272557 RepID=Q05E17_AERPE|nr:hypothetical protein [Aeropyrum pernix]BAF34784.1 hypothetical protein APE_1279a [Aeropyrum pernix K1]
MTPPLTRREFLLGVLWLGPRTAGEVVELAKVYSGRGPALFSPEDVEKAVEHFLIAGLARLDSGGRLVLERKSLHPSLREAAEHIAGILSKTLSPSPG